MDNTETNLTTNDVEEKPAQGLSNTDPQKDQRHPAKLRSTKSIKNSTSEDKKSKNNENKVSPGYKLNEDIASTSKSERLSTIPGDLDTDSKLLAVTQSSVHDELSDFPMKSRTDEFHAVISADKLDVSRFSQRLIKTLSGTDVNIYLLQSGGFACPIIVRDKSGLGLRMPGDTFTLADVKKCIGSRRIVQVLDTQTGVSENMSVKAYLRYFELSGRTRTLCINNLILSQTKLATHIEPPEVVRRTDWANLAYCAAGYNYFAEGTTPVYMRLQRLCDIAVAGSFTDFRIDAGGATRWYHVFRGSKIIWMVPPTAENYNQYLEWLMNPVKETEGLETNEHMEETISGQVNKESADGRCQFYADRVQNCQAEIFSAGSTLFIPAGWIYAIYSTEDSISFSGSFLHSFNVQTQLQVCQLENQLQTPSVMRFPLYTDLHWYVLEAYVRCLTGARHLTMVVKQELDEDHRKDDCQQLKRDRSQELKQEDETVRKSEQQSSPLLTDTNIKNEEMPNEENTNQELYANEGVEVKGQDELSIIDSSGGRSSIEPLLVDVKKANESVLIAVNQSDLDLKHSTSSKVVEGRSCVLDCEQEGGNSASWVHISSFEREGIYAIIDFLESYVLDSPPADIEDACGLITQAKVMLAVHSADNTKLSVTGRPILSTFDKKKEKIKLKQNCTTGHPSALSPFLGNLSPQTSSLSPSQSITNSMGRKMDANARRRRVRCKKCERCTSTECGDCAYCQDMKKFGGMGRLKQTCIGRQCMAPILPTAAICYFCKKSEAETGPTGGNPLDMLMECGICWKIAHPACLKLTYPELLTEGVVNEDLPSSWECPLCCVQGKRGQLKPRVVKGQGISRQREEGAEEEDDGQSSSIESNLADDDTSPLQSKNKNKSLQENKTILNTYDADQQTKVSDPSPSGSQNHVPETQWPGDSSSQLGLLESCSSLETKSNQDFPLGVTSAPLSPNRFISALYVVRPLPVAPPPKHVATMAGQSHVMDRDHWLRVFAWLTPGDLSTCMGVCKVWNRWAFDHRLWRKITLARKQIRKSHLIGIVRRQPKSLDLSMTNISNRQLAWLLARLPHLRDLDLSSNSWAAVSALCAPAVCPPGLAKLNLGWVTGIADPSLMELVSPPAAYGAAVRPGVQDTNVSRLRHCCTLRLTGTDITDSALMVCVRHLTRLEAVDLRLCVAVTDCGVRTLCVGLGDRLTELILTGCVHVTGAGLETVSRLCPNIKKLSMDGCTGITDEQKADFGRRHANCVAIF